MEKAIQTKQKMANNYFAKSKNENNNELKAFCIEEIEKLSDYVIGQKLINENWQHSIYKLDVSSFGTFFEYKITPLLPFTNDNVALELAVKDLI